MVNTKKYKNRFVTSLPVEKEDYDRLNRLLPKGVTIADEINKFIAERGQELEREKNGEGSIVVESSPIRSTDYNDTKLLVAAYDTTLDEYVCLYQNDTKRFKNLYNMSKEELYEYGHFINNHMTKYLVLCGRGSKFLHF